MQFGHCPENIHLSLTEALYAARLSASEIAVGKPTAVPRGSCACLPRPSRHSSGGRTIGRSPFPQCRHCSSFLLVPYLLVICDGTLVLVKTADLSPAQADWPPICLAARRTRRHRTSADGMKRGVPFGSSRSLNTSAAHAQRCVGINVDPCHLFQPIRLSR